MSCARGGDGSRDATRRTWRDEVSGHGAARRIKVAQQPASTPPGFVVARSARYASIRQSPFCNYGAEKNVWGSGAVAASGGGSAFVL